MISIVAVDKNWGIGKSGDIPWKIPGEQKFFKEKTLNSTVIMGRKTFESLPNKKPLKNRRNIILTTNKDFKVNGAEVFNSIKDAINATKFDKTVYIIGGAQIYRLLIPYCEKALIAKIEGKFDADTFHPNLDDLPNWHIFKKDKTTVAENGIKYTRYEYINKNIKSFKSDFI